MNDNLFHVIFGEALESADRTAFVSDWALSSVFAPDGEEPSEEIRADLIEQLGRIWDVAHMSVPEIRATTGLSQVKFAERFCVPRRTLEGWESRGSCPDYVRLMMAELLGIFDRNY